MPPYHYDSVVPGLTKALFAAFKASDGEPVKMGNVVFSLSEFGIFPDKPESDWNLTAVANDAAALNKAA